MQDTVSIDSFALIAIIAASAGLLLTGCNETALKALNSDPEAQLPGDGQDGDDDDATDPTGDDPADDNIDEPPPCEDTLGTFTWDWWASPAFGGADDPTDDSGRPFYQPDAYMIGWHTIGMPYVDIPAGQDVAFRAHFTVENLPPALLLSMQSDDGIWFWVNGTAVGHWGGAWQEEGCVNENAECAETTTVPPQDITDLLVPGENVVAARVSNAVMNAWFEVLTECVDE